MKHLALYLLFICFLSEVHAGDLPENKHRLKLTLIDQALLFHKSVRISYEYVSAKSLSGWEQEIAYTYFSKEENVEVSGLYIGPSYNKYLLGKRKVIKAIKFMPFYQRIWINHYLNYDVKTDRNGPFSEYHEFRKTKYTKERYGLSFISSYQFPITGSIFLEFNTGIGFIKFKTNVPADVTQKTFRNGIANYKEYESLNYLFNIKLGFSL
jgi:hypothetical protein